MIKLPWASQRELLPSTAGRRVLVLVDRASAYTRLVAELAPAGEMPPSSIVWLWVVTPGAVVSWGALFAESGDRTRMLLSALNERMEEARRFMTPLQRACHIEGIPCQSHILHGAVLECAAGAQRASRANHAGLCRRYALCTAGA
jgi:hypothetical protein